MKTVVVCCGAGMATSSILETKIKALLARAGVEAKVIKATVGQVPSILETGLVDLIVPSGKYGVEGVPSVSGMPYLTGVGVAKMEEAILQALQE